MKRLIVSILLSILCLYLVRNLFWVSDEELELTFFKRFDIKVFIVISTFLFMIIYKLVQYLAQFKIIENNSRIDIVFMVFVVCFMFVPMFGINHDAISKRENRTLANYVNLYDNGKINYNYGNDFANWFSDRFNQRKLFIDANNRVNKKINGREISDNALVGKNGWLFNRQHNSVAMFQNDNLFTSSELKTIGKQLEDFKKWTEEHHAKFYLYLTPDKETIYPEFYPENIIKVGNKSRMEQLVEYLGKHTDISVIYPIAELQKEKNKHQIYYTTGTHWNDTGAYVGYKTLFSKIKEDIPDLEIMPLTKIKMVEKKHADVDLANALAIDAYKTYPNKDMINKCYEVRKPHCVSEAIAYPDKANGVLTSYVNKDKSKRLNAVFFTDSFFIQSNAYAAESFHKMINIFVGFGKDFEMDFHKDKIMETNPDIFVVATTERFLQRLLRIKPPKE